MEINRFTKADWDCWGGSEKFHDLSEPLMATTSEWLLLGDGKGIRVYRGENEEYFWDAPLGSSWTPAMAKVIMAGLEKELQWVAASGADAPGTFATLKRYGFRTVKITPYAQK